MTETFTTSTTSYINIDERWDTQTPTFVADSTETTISAWTTDEDLDAQADNLAVAYATGADDLHDLLHAVRSHLRVAALAAAAPCAMTEAVVVVDNLNHLVTHATTDAELRTLADAAESGAGGPIEGLLEELVRLRNGERDARVFVAETGDAPRIGNLSDAE